MRSILFLAFCLSFPLLKDKLSMYYISYFVIYKVNRYIRPVRVYRGNNTPKKQTVA